MNIHAGIFEIHVHVNIRTCRCMHVSMYMYESRCNNKCISTAKMTTNGEDIYITAFVHKNI